MQGRTSYKNRRDIYSFTGRILPPYRYGVEKAPYGNRKNIQRKMRRVDAISMIQNLKVFIIVNHDTGPENTEYHYFS